MGVGGMTAWVDIPAARANADEPLDAGTCKAVQARLSALYENSIFDICCPGDPVEAALNATTSDATWAWIGHALPILARPQAGGDPRQMLIEAELKGSTDDEWTLRAYLLPTRRRPTIDATDCIVGVSSYVEMSCEASSYTETSGTVTTPGPSDALHGDSTVWGLSVPVWWLHLAHTGTNGITVYIRALRFREVLP